MFLKRNKVKKNGKIYEYGKIVRAVRREDGQPTQKVVKNLGRMKSEEDWEKAERILEAMKRGEEVVRLKEVEVEKQFEFGLSRVVEDLWERYGIGRALLDSFQERKPKFDPEQITLFLAVNRLYKPSSDLSAYRWIRDRAWPRTKVKPQWIYRTLDLLAQEKEQIEENLLEKLKEDLDLNLVFYDLTSTYFEGEGPDLADFGYSRDKREDRKQLVIGVVMADSVPIAHKVWPGNTADKSTLKDAVSDLKERFGIDGTTFVADRGVISSDNLEELESESFHYLLATPRRKDELAEKLLRQEVPGEEEQRAREVYQEGERRYVLCLNEERRVKDLEKLEEVVREQKTKLQDLKKRYESNKRGRPMTEEGAWKRVKKILGKNRRLFKVEVNETMEWELDRDQLDQERKIAGKFLLVTSSDLKPTEIMEKYKELKDVERSFDDLKNFLKLRPVYHWTDRRVKGHVFVCVLGLLLKKLVEKKADGTFREVKRELEPLKINQIQVREERIYKRNQLTPAQEEIFEALEVEKPPKFLTGEM